METVNSITAQLEKCHCVEDLRDAFSTAIKQLGYDGFDAFTVKSGTKDDIEQDYNLFICDYALDITSTALFDIWFPMDPVIAQLARSTLPFEYIEYLHKSQTSTSVVWQLGMLKLWRVKRAWAVPLNTVGFMRGMTVYTRGNDDEARKRFVDTRDEIHLMCMQFMAAFVRLSVAGFENEVDWSQSDTKITGISPREADCLHWAARGKTYWEVGKILGISENTVRFHLKNAFVKLGANSRSNAVSIAVREGIIEV